MNGTLIIDKPAGLTSHDVVALVRRAAHTRKVGHAGTLDPFATGVLVVCIGQATRLVRFLVGLDKEYLATLRCGYATDTQDLTGKQISPLQSSKGLSLEAVQDVLKHFEGPQHQLPPMYSAKKIGGERLHRLARAGREVERKPVPITIYEMRLMGHGLEPLRENSDGTCDVLVRVRCSSGTYVRTLAHDFGERLGCGAHLAALRRTAVGQFSIDQAVTLETVEQLGHQETLSTLLLPLSVAVAHLPEQRLTTAEVIAVSHGKAIATRFEGTIGNQPLTLRLSNASGELVAIGEYEPLAKMLRPRIVLNADSGAGLA